MLKFGLSVKVGLLGEPCNEALGSVRDRSRGPGVQEAREPLVDVFDEGDHLLVIAEMPGAKAVDIDYEIEHDMLCVSTQGERRYTKEILLPTPVKAPERSSYRNGIFYLKLPKAA